ncbi:Aspartic proteinase CDR1 [Linum grandiflorum]
MAPKTALIVFFLFIFFFFKYSDSLKLTTRLIHHDSIFSPFYNASETTADRAWRATRSSLARHAYLSSQPAGIQVGLQVEDTYHDVFYVNFSLGNPPVPQLAVMDTGSDFLWVRCLPCNPCQPMKDVKYFNPAMSTTFSPRPCTKHCEKCYSRWPWSPKHCMYVIEYEDGFHSEGIYATDQLSFRNSDDETTTVPNIAFGCANSVTGETKFHQHVSGVLGLCIGDPDALLSQHSFFNQFNYKFSYCLGRLSDPTYPYNQLAFGDAARLAGGATPLYIEGSRYRVHLVNISLATEMLDIDIKVFRRMSFRKGVVVDSGSTLFHLYTKAYDVVKAAIDKMASRVMQKVSPPGPPYELCYRGHVYQDPVGFPLLELHFVSGASLRMEYPEIFMQIDDDTFCMAIVRSESETSIGIVAQQSSNIGFDLKKKLMHFEKVGGCSIF